MVKLTYLFSSPRGDVIADDGMLGQKFAIGPSEYHPFITLGDFFGALGQFLLAQKQSCLPEILSLEWQRPVKADEIEEITVRYEKYGTLYQICSVDVYAGGTSTRLCASIAFSEPAKQTLEREFDLLAMLDAKKGPGFLPRIYKKDHVEIEKSGQVETMLVVLLQWFEGYEEWHFSRHHGCTRAFLWDMRRGYRFLSEAQTFDTVSQASLILTLYYDVESTMRISPWHHGGGDFIVRASEDGIDIKLITVRGYEPIGTSDGEGPLMPLCAFCIEAVTKMRLDKWEGMGDSTWADRFVIEAALRGFFNALKIKEGRGEMIGISPADVLQKLKSLDADQLRSLIKRHLLDNRESDLSDFRVLTGHLDSHISETYSAIQSFAG